MKKTLPYLILLGSILSSLGQSGGTNLTIVVQPQSQIVPPGANISFSVVVTGAGPYTFAWQFNGTNLLNTQPTSGTIASIAGNGVYGFSGDGGPATNAAFQDPWGLALDSSGNLFIVDNWNNRIRKISTNGIITTVAGNGIAGYSGDGGPATNASLYTYDLWGYGCNIALDTSGSVLIADTMNNRVRKVSASGIITTMAGNGSGGSSGDGGQATNASLNHPTGVTVDTVGNVLIAEFSGNRIRKVDTNGVITTVAGNGTGGFSGDGGQAANASLYGPGSLAVDSSGNIFIAEIYNNRIREVSASGTITTVAGTGAPYYTGDGVAATNAAMGPANVAVDGFGRLFIVDVANNRIREVGANGIITTIAGGGAGGGTDGLGDDGPATNATLSYPSGIVMDAFGNLYFSDTHNERIRRIAAQASDGTFTLFNVGANNAGNYQVIVSNLSQSVTSSVAVLQVNSTIMVNGHLAAGTAYSVGSAQVSFIDAFPSGFLLYTLDGSTPTTSSHIYFGPFTVTNSVVVQVLNVNSNDTQSVLSPQINLLIVATPMVTASPSNEVLEAGSPLDLAVSATGTPPLSYQWWKNSTPIPDATNAMYDVASVGTNDAGNYYAVVSNPYGSATSAVANVTVFIPVSITEQPTNEVVAAGETALFSVAATGYPAPSYQWSINSTNIPGATSNVLTVSHVGLTNLGTYAVLVSNPYSAQPSQPATLSMAPDITMPFTGSTVIWGQSVELSVGAIGSAPLSYQWFQNGSAIAGATNSTFTLGSVQFTNGGLYTVVVSSPFGSVTNTPAQLVVNPAGTSIGLYAGVTLTGTVGYNYIIQYTSDLQATNSWVTLTNLTLEQPVELWVDTSTNALTTPHRYYQVLPGH